MVCDFSTIPLVTFEDRFGKWRRRKAGKHNFFEQYVTFPSASYYDVHLDLPNSMQINDIQIVFGLTSPAKDFSINLYMTPSDSSYQIIRSESGHTANDYRICQLKEKYPCAARIDINFLNYTVGRSCTIFIQADDL